jgi:hypothetical protein
VKKLLVLLLSLFFLSSSSVFADDISDFEIEGISIGDSLLDYMTEDEILEQIELNKNRYEELNEQTKYIQINLFKDFQTYRGLGFLIKNNLINQYVTNKNDKYKILSIFGEISFNEDFEGCNKKLDEVVEILSNKFPNATKREFSDVVLEDSSGESFYEGTEFKFALEFDIETSCVNYEENFRSKKNWSEGLRITIMSKEIIEWLNDF